MDKEKKNVGLFLIKYIFNILNVTNGHDDNKTNISKIVFIIVLNKITFMVKEFKDFIFYSLF